MVVIIEQRFIDQLKICPPAFQLKFRKAYQQLKVVDRPEEIKGVVRINRSLYKLIIEESRISLRFNGQELTIGCFLYNQFYRSPDNE